MNKSYKALLLSNGRDRDGEERDRQRKNGDPNAYRDEYRPYAVRDEQFRYPHYPTNRNETDYIPSREPRYRSLIGFDMREPSAHSGESKRSQLEYGNGSFTEHDEQLTKEMAKQWIDEMQNEDGSKGMHWTYEQVEQVLRQKMLNLDPVELWLAMNMVWSDFYQVAKKHNVNSTDFYLDLAKAFLNDKDAGKDKLYRYFQYVAK